MTYVHNHPTPWTLAGNGRTIVDADGVDVLDYGPAQAPPPDVLARVCACTNACTHVPTDIVRAAAEPGARVHFQVELLTGERRIEHDVEFTQSGARHARE